MDLKSTGMEFCYRNDRKILTLDLKITEVPTTLSVSIAPRTPHLKPFRDGIRHLKLMFTYSFIKLFNVSFNFGITLFSIFYFGILFSPLKLGV